MRQLAFLVLIFFSAARAQEPHPNTAAPAPVPDTKAPQPPKADKPDAAPEQPKAPIANTFKIVFDKEARKDAYTGRVFVAFCKDTKAEPRRVMGDWTGQNPVYSMEVKDVEAGGTVELRADARAFPRPLADLEPGEYAVQAIARVSQDCPHVGAGDGDLYSEPVTVTLKPGETAVTELKLTKVAAEPKFQETDRIKYLSIPSPLLSKFYGREVSIDCTVILPIGYSDAKGDTKFPTVYFIGGFGGSHRFAPTLLARLPQSASNSLIVVPDPSCGTGHHVFADSATNGPRAKSFFDEIIPAVESHFRGAASPSNRWIYGISSGGWSALWLLLSRPDAFAGCWSFCPDPVDFRDFQRIDLYAENANMYKTPTGDRRPLMRAGERVLAYYDEFARRDWVLYPGGQISSFEAVFSPRGEDGQPLPLFDRATGAINHNVALEWEKYDIRLVIERNWKELGPHVKQKMHIYAGGEDNFYLDSSVRKLRDSMKQLFPDPDIHIVRGMGHDIPRPPLDVMFRVVSERSMKQGE